MTTSEVAPKASSVESIARAFTSTGVRGVAVVEGRRVAELLPADEVASDRDADGDSRRRAAARHRDGDGERADGGIDRRVVDRGELDAAPRYRPAGRGTQPSAVTCDPSIVALVRPVIMLIATAPPPLTAVPPLIVTATVMADAVAVASIVDEPVAATVTAPDARAHSTSRSSASVSVWMSLRVTLRATPTLDRSSPRS